MRRLVSSAVATMRARQAASSACASAPATAAATNSVNAASRRSVPAGSAFRRADAAIITPHSRPSMLIGAPAEERIPVCRAATATAPPSARSSTCTGWPVSNTSVLTSCPPSADRRPASMSLPALLQAPATSTARPTS